MFTSRCFYTQDLNVARQKPPAASVGRLTRFPCDTGEIHADACQATLLAHAILGRRNRRFLDHASGDRPGDHRAAIGFEGQVTVFDMRSDTSPCYHCLFPDEGDNSETRCTENGVFAPLVGMIGTTQAAEALKILMGIGTSLQGRLLLLDVADMQWRTITLKKDPHCAVCASSFAR